MCKITISLDTLQRLEACTTGIRTLRETLGDHTEWTENWTRDRQLEILRTPLRKYLGWAVINKIIPLWSMNEVDLHGVDLHVANLYKADLSGADLSGADLYEADLSGANLRGVNLTGEIL